jgi:hypothetical protein
MINEGKIKAQVASELEIVCTKLRKLEQSEEKRKCLEGEL